MKDVDAVRQKSPHVLGVNPQQDRNVPVVWRNKNTNVQVTGTAAKSAASNSPSSACW